MPPRKRAAAEEAEEPPGKQTKASEAPAPPEMDEFEAAAQPPPTSAPGQERTRVLILGAAGRDYHNFNVLYKHDKRFTVVAFTHAYGQIPELRHKRYPPALAGPLYPQGIPIHPEDQLEALIRQHGVQRCVMSYSDLSYTEVMQLGARVQMAGADFVVPTPLHTMLRSAKPIIAVTAVRTGCGKSQCSKYITNVLRQLDKRVVLVRHPMPYGDLEKQRLQRFASLSDLEAQEATIEEREEYEQHVKNGAVVLAGVDYAAILKAAEDEADVILWDGGNNDTPFFQPDLWLCITDPHRAGHGTNHWPGDVNLRCADVIVVNKANTASEEKIRIMRDQAHACNPRATLLVTDSVVETSRVDAIKGNRVVCVDDGPTITHGGMAEGAAVAAAEKFGAAEIVDARPYAVGSIKDTYQRYGHIGSTIPAVGYSEQQIKDLEATINAVPCDAVVIGTPIDLALVISINKPTCTVTYDLRDRGPPPHLSDCVQEWAATMEHKEQRTDRLKQAVHCPTGEAAAAGESGKAAGSSGARSTGQAAADEPAAPTM